MKLPRVTFAVAVQYLSLAICVLGRPQPSSSEVLDEKGSSPLLGFLEVPERRLLKGSGGRGGRAGGFSGGGGGGGNLSTTVTIIVITSTVAFLILLAALLLWCNLKKKKNPNWRFVDCFKRNKPATEKLFTSVKSDDEHKMTVVDAPRMDHSAKSRKQASLSHDFKNSTSLK